MKFEDSDLVAEETEVGKSEETLLPAASVKAFFDTSVLNEGERLQIDAASLLTPKIYKTKDRYNNLPEYLDTYDCLMRLEQFYEQYYEDLKVHNIELKFSDDLSEAEFYTTDSRSLFRIGDEIVVYGDTDEKSILGRVKKQSSADFDNVEILFLEPVTFNVRPNKKYVLERLPDSTTYARCMRAINDIKQLKPELFGVMDVEDDEEEEGIDLKVGRRLQLAPKFHKPDVPLIFFEQIAGLGNTPLSQHELFRFDETAKSASNLNDDQKAAAAQISKHRLSLVKGPPGTGKTSLSLAVVRQALACHKKVLFCSPSNVGVENFADKFIQKCDPDEQKKAIHIYSSRHDYKNVNSDIGLYARSKEDHNLALRDKNLEKLEKKFALLKNKMDPKERKEMDRLKMSWYKQIIANYSLFLATCSSTGSALLRNQTFDLIVIDEATKDTEPNLLVPIVKGTSDVHVVLIGDNDQLGPVIKCKNAKEQGFDVSMFERLIENSFIPKTMLCTQYRMEKKICHLVSDAFYEGKLKNGVSDDSRKDQKTANLFPHNVVWIHHAKDDKEENKSFKNEEECKIVVALIKILLDAGVNPTNIGVVTPYSAQCSLISNQLFSLDKPEIKEIEILSADGFQGREKDYMIVSIVRSNGSKDLGFVADKRRLNVSFSRAKFGLYVVGNGYMFKNYAKAGTIFADVATKVFRFFDSGSNLIMMAEDFLRTKYTYLPTVKQTSTSQRNFCAPQAPILTPLLQGKVRICRNGNNITFHIHSSCIGFVFGLKKQNLRNLENLYGVRILDANTFQPPWLTIMIICPSLAVANFIEMHIQSVYASYFAGFEGLHVRLKTTNEVRKDHPPPTKLSDVYRVEQKRETFVEFQLRNDMIGLVVGPRQQNLRKLCADKNIPLIYGVDRDWRSYQLGNFHDPVDFEPLLYELQQRVILAIKESRKRYNLPNIDILPY